MDDTDGTEAPFNEESREAILSALSIVQSVFAAYHAGLDPNDAVSGMLKILDPGECLAGSIMLNACLVAILAQSSGTDAGSIIDSIRYGTIMQ